MWCGPQLFNTLFIFREMAVTALARPASSSYCHFAMEKGPAWGWRAGIALARSLSPWFFLAKGGKGRDCLQERH
jgi:hypothetical protein